MASRDARAAKRRRTNRPGILKSSSKEFTVLLRDATEAGARVRLVTSCDVPERVTLVSAMEKIDTPCTVVWRRGNDLGLKFG